MSTPMPAGCKLLVFVVTALTGIGLGMAQAETPMTGEAFRDCADCPEMRVIPVASAVAAASALSPFAIGRFEVTFDEWDACVGAGGCNGYRPDDMGWGRGRQPVILVNWNEAQGYLAWLRQRTGRPYRLPTDAEWEHVAAGGGLLAESAGEARPGPVDASPANDFGVAGLGDGISEWVEDCWEYIDGACRNRIWRGSSWATTPGGGRQAQRSRNYNITRSTILGFRVALPLVPTQVVPPPAKLVP